MRRPVLVRLVAAGVVTGCRGGTIAGDAVDSYIQSVNNAQAHLKPAFTDAQAGAVGAFAAGRVTEHTAQRLRGGNATVGRRAHGSR